MSETSVKMNIPTDATGTLKWLFIDGEGKENLSGVKKFTAQVILSPEQAQPYIEQVNAFWEENKPATWKITAADLKKEPQKFKGLKVGESKPPVSLGYKEDDDGNFVFTYNTNTTYADGTPKVVEIFNAKANKISLGGKKIGNGSEGALGGIMDIYNNKNLSVGVTFYLNAVQLTKFVEFTGSAGFDAAEVEGGFEGIDQSMDQFSAQSEGGGEEQAKPRL